MKLKHITFTGIGPNTDLDELRKIQEENPIVEFGILMSKNWQENGPRYFDPSKLNILRDSGLNLSCHVCGSVARATVRENWEPLFALTDGLVGIFKRCQLNIGSDEPTEETEFLRPPIDLEELIIQQKDANNLGHYNMLRRKDRISILLDASGGLGIDTPIVPFDIKGVKVGYAGGMNPENVGKKLDILMSSDKVGDFWIDMESGVRTNEVFDIDKVKRVLNVCNSVISKYNG